jgi:hypothetical protein
MKILPTNLLRRRVQNLVLPARGMLLLTVVSAFIACGSPSELDEIEETDADTLTTEDPAVDDSNQGGADGTNGSDDVTNPNGDDDDNSGTKPGESGGDDPGDTDPGDTDPGDTDPGDTDPGDNDPGDNDPGDNDPGDNDPGDTDPGDTDPGDNDPPNTNDGNPVDPSECIYPFAFTSARGEGAVLPQMRWDGALQADGTPIDLDLKEFYCDPIWADYETISFVMVTAWCPNCPGYLNDASNIATQLDSNGSLLVYLVLENTSYNPASNAAADQYISGYVGSNDGIRAGGGGAEPSGLFANLWDFVPNGFMIRKSDMRIIAHQENSNYFLPYVDLAQNPAAAFYENNCSASDDENLEPNNKLAEAPVLSATTSFSAGICDQNPDIYYIDVAGAWTFSAEFTHSVGDLDIHVVDAEGNSLSESWSATNDEEVSHSGPAFVAVIGYDGSSAPYSVSLSVQ